MTDTTLGTAQLTYEGLVDAMLAALRAQGLPGCAPGPAPWDAFERLSHKVHSAFEVPSTTISAMMRRLLFGLACAHQPRCIVGAGTFAGYAFTWLLRDRSDPEGGPFPEAAVGLDVDPRATALATRNCSVLKHGERLTFHIADAREAVCAWGPIDLLYLDVDDPVAGKGGYAGILERALRHLRPGALVLAHDPCVPRFSADFLRYHDAVRAAGLLGPWVLPVDECGLSVAAVPL